jgi:hypothetical protein
MIERTHILASIAAIDPSIKSDRLRGLLALDSTARDTAVGIKAPILRNSTIRAAIDTAATSATPNTLKRRIVSIYILADKQLAEVKHRAIARIDNKRIATYPP